MDPPEPALLANYFDTISDRLTNEFPGRCCCGVLSISAGAHIIAVTMVLGSVEMVVCTLKSYYTQDELWATIAICFVEILTGLLVFIACNKKYSVLMTPALFFT
ncbi:hypothetical protein PMAYCL1PPCAC_05848, partial [Pristionchus mayeri]